MLISKPHFGQQITVQYLTPVNQEILYQFGTFFLLYMVKGQTWNVLWELKNFAPYIFGQLPTL